LALKKTDGNQSTAAKILGLHRNTLSRKITLHKLNGRH
jgi:DNA-binding protein Fis